MVTTVHVWSVHHTYRVEKKFPGVPKPSGRSQFLQGASFPSALRRAIWPHNRLITVLYYTRRCVFWVCDDTLSTLGRIARKSSFSSNAVNGCAPYIERVTLTSSATGSLSRGPSNHDWLNSIFTDPWLYYTTVQWRICFASIWTRTCSLPPHSGLSNRWWPNTP